MWNADNLEAFKQIQMVITSAPVLAKPNFSQPFSIECDASGTGIGVVLSLNHSPIAFFSKALADPRLQNQYMKKI